MIGSRRHGAVNTYLHGNRYADTSIREYGGDRRKAPRQSFGLGVGLLCAAKILVSFAIRTQSAVFVDKAVRQMKASQGLAAKMKTISGGFAMSARLGEVDGFHVGQFSIDNGESIGVVPMVRPPPEPPPWVERSARVCESFPFSYYIFVSWILVNIYVVRFASLFENLACFYVVGSIWIYGARYGCVKPATWLAIRVALSGVIVSKSDHSVWRRSFW
ncbi:unnamed protein product, partial [Cuscuta europaea]